MLYSQQTVVGFHHSSTLLIMYCMEEIVVNTNTNRDYSGDPQPQAFSNHILRSTLCRGQVNVESPCSGVLWQGYDSQSSWAATDREAFTADGKEVL